MWGGDANLFTTSLSDALKVLLWSTLWRRVTESKRMCVCDVHAFVWRRQRCREEWLSGCLFICVSFKCEQVDFEEASVSLKFIWIVYQAVKWMWRLIMFHYNTVCVYTEWVKIMSLPLIWCAKDTPSTEAPSLLEAEPALLHIILLSAITDLHLFNFVSDLSSDNTEKLLQSFWLRLRHILLTLFIFQSLISPPCSAACSLIMIRLFTLLTLLIAQLQHDIDLFVEEKKKPSGMHSQEITDKHTNMINVF